MTYFRGSFVVQTKLVSSLLELSLNPPWFPVDCMTVMVKESVEKIGFPKAISMPHEGRQTGSCDSFLSSLIFQLGKVQTVTPKYSAFQLSAKRAPS